MSIGKEEWFKKVKDNYRKASRFRKSQILDELEDLHGIHRKTAIRLMSPKKRGRKSGNKRGPKSKYDNPEFVRALKTVWKETDYMCSKLLNSAMEEWVPSVEVHYGKFTPEIRKLLLQISPATIDRKLKPHKGKSQCGTKPGTILKTEIPIQGNTFDYTLPGFMEADTVAHCGNSMSGQFIWSLTMTDICTGWTECRAVWHKAAKGVVEQVKNIEAHLPFKMLGFDCDNVLNQVKICKKRYKKSERTEHARKIRMTSGFPPQRSSLLSIVNIRSSLRGALTVLKIA